MHSGSKRCIPLQPREPDPSRSRFAINVGSNLAYILLSTVTMLWYVPYLIENLGVGTYGLIALVASLTGALAIIADSLNTAALRLLGIDINQENTEAANKTFNTSLSMTIFISLAALPFLGFFALFFPMLFTVPAGVETEASWLFGCVAAGFLLTLVGTNFNVSALILHRFDLRNLVEGLALVARVGVVVLAFQLMQPRLWQVGAAFLASGLISLVSGWYVWRHLTPQLHIRWLQFDRVQLRELASLGGWGTVIRVGLLLFAITDLLVINLVFGPEMTGRYGALVLFAELVRAFAVAVASVFSPAILAHYARQENEELRDLAAKAVKLMGLAIALPSGLICGLAEPLLRTWLGEVFSQWSALLIVIVAPLVINFAVLPLAYVLTSHNKIRLQGYTTIALGWVNLVLAVAVALWSGLGPIGVALVTAVVLTSNNLFLTSYSAKVMQLPWYSFYPALISGTLHMAAVALIAFAATRLYEPSGWLQLAILGGAIGIGYCAVAYLVSLNADDRLFLRTLIPPALRQYIASIVGP
jgi:membrane protein EpsK